MSETQENQQKMKNFTITCNNEVINCHAEIPSEFCVFLWIGQDSTATMAFGLLKHKSVIYGSPTPICAMQINEFASRVAKLFDGRQVFVSTDLDQERDKNFWTDLYTVMKEYILANAEFFQLDKELKS
uniref:Gelsolin n=1 Tax=Panagrolaimus sp. JU765 TaxID=591449 RepID=A0AC34RCX6_9BILA